MIGENGYPETPDWQLPRPVVQEVPRDEPHLVRGEN